MIAVLLKMCKNWVIILILGFVQKLSIKLNSGYIENNSDKSTSDPQDKFISLVMT